MDLSIDLYRQSAVCLWLFYSVLFYFIKKSLYKFISSFVPHVVEYEEDLWPVKYEITSSLYLVRYVHESL